MGSGPATFAEQLPPVASLAGPQAPQDYLFRTVSSVASVAINGSATYRRSSNASPESTELFIDSTSDTLEWAVYRLDVGSFEPSGYQVIAQVDNGECYYALADFDTDSWRIRGPFAGSFSHSPTVGESTVEELNFWSYLAVLAWDGTDVRVEEVSVEFEQPEFAELELENLGAWGDLSASASYNLEERHPLLAVIDRHDGRLEYWESDRRHPQDVADWDTQVVDIEDGVLFNRCSLWFNLDRPAIAYTSDSDVRYAGSELIFPAGAADWTKTTIHTAPGNIPVLRESKDDFLPLVAWGEATPEEDHVRFAYADQILPESDEDWHTYWLDPLAADTTGYCSMTLLDGVPWVLYYYPNAETTYKLAIGASQVPENIGEWQRVPFGVWNQLGELVSPYPFHQYPLVADFTFYAFAGYFEDKTASGQYSLITDSQPPVEEPDELLSLPLIRRPNSQAERYCDFTMGDEGLYYFAALSVSEALDYELLIGYGLSTQLYAPVTLEDAYYVTSYPLADSWSGNKVQLVVNDGKPLVFYLSKEGADWHLRQLYQTN
jgi:hypothetical protein